MITEQLIDAHLKFILDNHNAQKILKWLQEKPIRTLIEFDDLLAYLQQLDLTEHLQKAIHHPATATVTIEQIVDVMAVDELAQYISNKTEDRQKLIKTIVYHPVFSSLISKIIERYLNNPLFKAGKSVLEQTLQKKLGKISEDLLHQYLTDDKLYHIQADIWHKIKDIKLKQIIDEKDISKPLAITKSFWMYFSQSEFFKTLLQDWYNHANTGKNLSVIAPIFTHYINSEAFALYTRKQLEAFYYLPETQKIINTSNN